MANLEAILKKDKKDNSGTYCPVCFTSVPGKHMTQILFLTISGPVKMKEVTGRSLLGFTEGKDSKYHLP